MELSKEIARIQEQIAGSEKGLKFSKSAASKLDARAMASLIDHTLLKLDATPQQIDILCHEARNFGFKTVCVRLPYVSQAREHLEGSAVGVCCVVGFHEGTYTANEKLEEAKSALAAGAVELDTVLNRAHVHEETNYDKLDEELRLLRSVAQPPTRLKLILETSQLDEKQIIAATVVAYHAGLDFVKTSTGFCGHGARMEHVSLMRRTADMLEKENGRHMSVKASGGVKTFSDALDMVGVGAERLGVSAGVAIVQGVGASADPDTTDY